MAKVSGSLKNLIKKIIFIKNQHLENEKEILGGLRTSNPVNYHEAMHKVQRKPWVKRIV